VWSRLRISTTWHALNHVYVCPMLSSA
jgi:hypothetical protein